MDEHRPLTAPQAAIWWDDAATPQATFYNVAEALRIRGGLRPDLLFRAIARTDAAADALRLRFTQVDGQPRQFLDPEPKRDFALLDVSHADDPEAAAQVEIEQATFRPYDLQNGPLHRHRLVRLAPDDHLWLRAFHHLIWDGYSATMELSLIARTYAALLQGQPPPELTLGSYTDYMADDAAYAGSQAREQDLAYWREALARGGPLAGFSEKPPAPARGPARRLRSTLDTALVAGLAAAAGEMGSTLPNLLLAAYLLALARAARSDRPACQVAMLNRYGPSQRNVIGVFAQIAPLGLDLSQGLGFAELVRQVTDLQRAHRRHGRLTLALSARDGLDPWQGGTPWGASFNAMDFPYDLGFPGLRVVPEIQAVGPVHDVSLAVCAQQRRSGAGQVTLLWFYNPERHTQEGVSRLAARYQALLAAILADPQAHPQALAALPAEEERTLAAWETGPPAPAGCGDLPVHLGFWRQAQATPHAPAVSAAGRDLDYAGLAARAAALALLLRDRGVDAETPVGLCLGATPELVVGYLGIMAAGGAVLPLEPTLPPTRLGEMALGLGCPLVLTQGRWRRRLPGELARRALIIDLDELPPALVPPEGFAPAPAAPGQLACVFHTSGSTGRPKPVGVLHGALAAKMATMTPYFGITPGEVFCAAASLAFDPLLQQLFLPLTTGGKIWLPGATLLVDPPAFWPQAAAQGVTHLNLVPSMLDALLEGAPPHPLPAIRRLVVGGERLPPELAARAQAILGMPDFWNMYGPTETTVDATGWRVDPDAHEEIPIGRPLTGYAVRLLDQDLRRAPVGQAGEICIGGMGLARGYLGRPEQTRERFTPDPYGPPGSRLYRSGDYAFWREDGAMVFLGRRDDQVKIRGQRIELGEVEAALRSQPGVSQAAVIFRKDESGGSLTAYVVGEAAPRELAQALTRVLPRAAVPGRFVAMECLPMLPSGKVDRLALAAREAAPAPRCADRPAVSGSGGGGVLRRAIAQVWAELLGREEVDHQANLFEMGAHSLLVPRAVARIGALAGRPVSSTELFQYPSVAALAAHLAGAPAGRPAPIATATAPAPGAGQTEERAVAVIGMALRLPGADDPDAFWDNLRRGVCSVSSPEEGDLLAAGASPALLRDPAFRPQQGRLEGVELFDPAPFAYTPAEAMEMDPQQRLLLETAWRALEDAGCDPAADGPVGAVAGVGFNAYLLDNLGTRLAAGSLTDRYMLMLGNDKDHAATRLGYKLGLSGPVMNLNTACSTGLAAVAEAVEMLRAGRARVMLAGGASLGITTQGGYLYAEGGIGSFSGVCRPFDAEADGTVPGSGVGVVALKRLDHALADGDTIHAVIRGVGVSNDGSARAAFTAPSVDGQAAALAQALADARVEPASLGFVEGHGTGTALGDPIEAQALALAYGGGDNPPPAGSILLGSLKGNLGHLDAAAGVAGLIKAVLALKAGEVPPTCGLRRPSPRIDWAAGPFRVSGQAEPWPPRPEGQPRRAAVSSFGVGGTNVHLVLEQAPEPKPAAPEEPSGPVLLALSAAGPEALEELAGSLAARLPKVDSLADAAATMAGRRRLRHRLAVVAANHEEAAANLTQAKAPGRARGVCQAGGVSPALVFPGQGSQHPGMGRDLYDGEPLFRRLVDEARDILADGPAAGLRELILADPADQAAAARLANTAVTQPALFTVEYATARLLMRYGLLPEALAGHSVGEYVAACLAGVMGFPEALALVAERGRLMASAPPGAMLALALGEDEARPLVEAVGGGVCLAVINGPRQCVAAGEETAVTALEARVAALGRPARRLAVSHAFHCHLMDPILEDFRAAVAGVDLRPPRIPLASNLSGDWLTAGQATDPDYWVRHLRGQVRFAANLALLLAEPDRLLVEAGPGQVLTRLALANGAEPGRALASQPHPADLDGRSSLRLALGGLWLRGWEPDWTALANGRPRRRSPLPTYPFQRRRLWIDAKTPPAAGPGREAGALDRNPPAHPAPPADLCAALAEVWREAFGLPAVSPDDDFLSLGGDSLLAVRLAGRIRERLGRPVAVADIFVCRTVRALAQSLDGGAAAAPSLPAAPAPAAAPAREEGVL